MNGVNRGLGGMRVCISNRTDLHIQDNQLQSQTAISDWAPTWPESPDEQVARLLSHAAPARLENIGLPVDLVSHVLGRHQPCLRNKTNDARQCRSFTQLVNLILFLSWPWRCSPLRWYTPLCGDILRFKVTGIAEMTETHKYRLCVCACVCVCVCLYTDKPIYWYLILIFRYMYTDTHIWTYILIHIDTFSCRLNWNSHRYRSMHADDSQYVQCKLGYLAYIGASLYLHMDSISTQQDACLYWVFQYNYLSFCITDEDWSRPQYQYIPISPSDTLYCWNLLENKTLFISLGVDRPGWAGGSAAATCSLCEAGKFWTGLGGSCFRQSVTMP